MSDLRKQYHTADTNVFLMDPIAAIYGFAPRKRGNENHLVIPGNVLDEMEKFKTEQNTERGANSRLFSRELMKIVKGSGKSINEPIRISDNYYLRVSLDSSPVNFSTAETTNDDYIIGVAKYLQDNVAKAGDYVELVSNDTLVYLKGSALGLNVSDWRSQRAVSNIDDLYTGSMQLSVPKGLLRKASDGILRLSDIHEQGKLYYPNQYFALTDDSLKKGYEIPSFGNNADNTTNFGLVRYIPRMHKGTGGFVPVKHYSTKAGSVMNIQARNFQQAFALDALSNPKIKLVNLLGPAGSGKTLLAIASGLNSIKSKYNDSKGAYNKLLISRLMVSSSGDELGFLPGDISSKMSPFLQPIYDNFKPIMFEDFVNKTTKSSKERNKIKHTADPMRFRDFLQEEGVLEIQPMSTLRGRSIDGSFIVLDEGQNVSPAEVKTLITRAGEGTKIVITGDPDQIDRGGLTSLINGLLHASENFKGEEVAGSIFLPKGERSELATLGARLL